MSFSKLEEGIGIPVSYDLVTNFINKDVNSIEDLKENEVAIGDFIALIC